MRKFVTKFYYLKIKYDDKSFSFTELLRLDKSKFELMIFEKLENLYDLVYDEW